MTIGIRGTNFAVGIFGNRVVTDVADARVTVCPWDVRLPDPEASREVVRAAGCRDVSAGDPALAASRQGFSRATAQETTQLWRLLDTAHLALDRRIQRDPAAYQEAALLQQTFNRLGALPALGPFASPLLVTGIPNFASADVVQNAIILPEPPQQTPDPPPPPPPRVFPFLGGFGGGSTSLFADATADRAIVTFGAGVPPTVNRIELQNGQIRQRGTAQAIEAEFFGVIGLERWTGFEEVEGTFSDGRRRSGTLSQDQGLHVLYGAPPTNLPTTGIVNYNFLRATSPTIADGSRAPGSFYTYGDGFTPGLAIDFGQRKVGVSIIAEIGSVQHKIETAGGLESPSLNLLANSRFSSGGRTVGVEIDPFENAETSSPACRPESSGPRRASIEGFLPGPRGAHAGVLYQFGKNSDLTRLVTGAAIFRAGD